MLRLCQKRVFQSPFPLIFSLDLDAWINEPPSESESEDEQPKAIFTKEEPKHARPRHTEVDEKELAKVRAPEASGALELHDNICLVKVEGFNVI